MAVVIGTKRNLLCTPKPYIFKNKITLIRSEQWIFGGASNITLFYNSV